MQKGSSSYSEILQCFSYVSNYFAYSQLYCQGSFEVKVFSFFANSNFQLLTPPTGLLIQFRAFYWICFYACICLFAQFIISYFIVFVIFIFPSTLPRYSVCYPHLPNLHRDQLANEGRNMMEFLSTTHNFSSTIILTLYYCIVHKQFTFSFSFLPNIPRSFSNTASLTKLIITIFYLFFLLLIVSSQSEHPNTIQSKWSKIWKIMQKKGIIYRLYSMKSKLPSSPIFISRFIRNSYPILMLLGRTHHLTLLKVQYCEALQTLARSQKWDHNLSFYYYQHLIMSQRNSSSSEKLNQGQLAIRRAQFIKKLKIKVKLSDNQLQDDRLILIQTYNTEKNISVELIMRKISQLDSFIAHINNQHGGHIIPVFKFDLYFQDSLEMGKLVPAIQQYLNDLKHNKYCRQDIKFYCFIIEQHTSFPKQYTLAHMINNATDASRKYLNQLFTRKTMSSLKNADIMTHAHKQLTQNINQYNQIKQISLVKSKQIIMLEEMAGLFAEMSSWPGMAIEPQDFDIDFICKTIITSEKLIEQSKCAYSRWEKLVDNVRELQNNVYKGLHQYSQQFNQINEQLKNWSQSLSRQFYDLSDFLSNKMQALCMEVYKINKKFIDMTVFAGQTVELPEDCGLGVKKSLQKGERQQKSNNVGVYQQKGELKLMENSLQIEDERVKIQGKSGEKKNVVLEHGFEGQKKVGKMSTIVQTLKNKEQITCDDD